MNQWKQRWQPLVLAIAALVLVLRPARVQVFLVGSTGGEASGLAQAVGRPELTVPQCCNRYRAG